MIAPSRGSNLVLCFLSVLRVSDPHHALPQPRTELPSLLGWTEIRIPNVLLQVCIVFTQMQRKEAKRHRWGLKLPACLRLQLAGCRSWDFITLHNHTAPILPTWTCWLALCIGRLCSMTLNLGSASPFLPGAFMH